MNANLVPLYRIRYRDSNKNDFVILFCIKMDKKQTIELLAPAKNLECGIAAINHGADAVYIAAPKFGAREAAGNPISDIEQVCNYAHRYYAKVYLVLNTILYEDELEQAVKIIAQAYNIGCDAAIIQDMGLLETGLAPIPLFASTQTHNYKVDKIKFLESVGFQRIILARELSLDQIAEIHRQTTVELEAFVHGALCVSYSGQCYMSQATTWRSANRGACAQLCRLPYDLLDEQGNVLVDKKHFLSLRDLNLSYHLGELMDAGISSFKIEGRLKDISYVKNITALYRKELDKLLNKSENYKKASSGVVQLNFEPDARQSFSRGFTSYFLNGRDKALASFDSPKSKGQYIGKALKKEADFFIIDLEIVLNNGDGICFIDKSGILQGTRINRVEGNKVYPLNMKGINAGLEIYRNFNFQFDKKLSGESAERKIAVGICFESSKDNIRLTAVDEDNISAILTVPQNGEPAKNAGRALQSFREQLSKTGNSIFTVKSLVIEVDEVCFYPASQINAWRRELIDLLKKKRTELYKRPFVVLEPNSIPYPGDNLDYTANIANSLAAKFYCRHRVKNFAQAFEIVGNVGKTVLMFNRYCIKYEMGFCPRKQNAEPTGNLYLQNSNKQKFKLVFDCTKCEMQVEKQGN
ncbi:MAG: U32 family peptidase [Prevotellaceae bacterium]|jgi:putative protease|nr:U32 family peptidase [Prevotellaceae bacterium]